jgi:thiamine-phosphate pyrophosphorylase
MPQQGKFPPLYLILDAGFLAGVEDRAGFLRSVVQRLAEAGVGILQYRNKAGHEAEILADACEMRQAAGARMLLILNDWPALTVEAGFDGVHVGQTDLSPAEARRIVGPEKMVGVSTHNEAQLRAADLEPVDYIAIGPVCATATKANPEPLVAIGGISLQNAGKVRDAGADSVAVISAVFSPEGDAVTRAADFLRVLGGNN